MYDQGQVTIRETLRSRSGYDQGQVRLQSGSSYNQGQVIIRARLQSG
jgi:hypothetical protein